MKPFVVPDASERWTTVIAPPGSLTPGFSRTMAASLQLLILPRKMFAIVAPSSLSPFGAPLYATVIAPNAIGIWTPVPLFAPARSSAVSAGSVAPKSAVPACHCATPAPDPTGW